MKVFDAHFHIIDPTFPLIPNQGFLPETYLVNNYLNEMKPLEPTGGVVVSGSFQGFDTSYLLACLSTLGKCFHGVANIPSTIGDDEVLILDEAGVAGVRFNLFRGGSERLSEMVNLSARLYELCQWHTELYVASSQLAHIRNQLSQLNSFCIDHLGLEKEGLSELYYWVEKGAMVKATGFGRLDFDPVEAMKQIMRINPNALMFGSDLPSTRSPERFSMNDLNLLKDNFDSKLLDKILHQNGLKFYSRNN